ncbi:Nan1p ASCRUDRAFT_71691 [Ascoidea rubescens DSM 1968]|uniref:WD repeat-containing protein 75 second beta-propeller domain-containing protein n=1 Tax=Ascoidea rubescens DSM 1968 TaxID=1344418 RepID=A0A1D2VCH1_9ASCO|nr:hypothetical protein ASCRUDRAFT_71691 [Ascoidea rubescens DSM 1968]ODV59331.1 hypothetical protein ASCRUDRAFT_71691 [Ascoidea rubescens DSM 1968]
MVLINNFSKYNIISAGGGKLVRSSNPTTAFSNDNKTYLVLFTNQIKIYNLLNKICIKTISFEDNKKLSSIIDLKYDPVHTNIIWLFYSNGEILIFNINSQSEVKRLKVEGVKFLKVLKINSSYEIIAITQGQKPNIKCAAKLTLTSNLSSSELNGDFIEFYKAFKYQNKNLTQVSNVSFFSVSPNKNSIAFLIATNNNILVKIYTIDKNQQNQFSIVFNSSLTSIALSNNRVLALGSKTGVINLFYSSNKSRALRWHVDKVNALSFSSDNNYLLSGGLEKVLVFWQLNSDKKQFLPRLSGPILDISNSTSYFNLTLQLNGVNDLQYLVLNAIDFTSRISINTIRPEISNYELYYKDLKKLKAKSKDFQNNGKVNGNKHSLKDLVKVKHDFTCSFEINNNSNYMYIPNGSQVQAFNLNKNEQVFTQNLINAIQSAGKVRSEKDVEEAKVHLVSFTNDGSWMCTFDSFKYSSPKNKLLIGDEIFTLKFWIFNKVLNSWELTTKIMNPHGPNNYVYQILAAPSSYCKGVSFLTVDNIGGLKVWKPNVVKENYSINNSNVLQNHIWSLSKFFMGNPKLKTNAISAVWSKDASTIFLSLENKISIINFHELNNINRSSVIELLPLICETRIRSLKLTNNDNNLIILSKNKLINFNLLNFKIKWQFKLNNLVSIHSKNLIDVSQNDNIIALAVNYIDPQTYKYNAKIFMIDCQTTSKNFISVKKVENYICSLKWVPNTNDFIFFDFEYNILRLTSDNNTKDKIADAKMETSFRSLLKSAVDQKSSVVKAQSSLREEDPPSADVEDVFWYGKNINSHTFDAVIKEDFEFDDFPLESLFDRAMRCL